MCINFFIRYLTNGLLAGMLLSLPLSSTALELVAGDNNDKTARSSSNKTIGSGARDDEPITNAGIALPSIGRISQSVTDEEQRIGAAWLKQYRRQVPTSSDPIVIHYLETLLATLASHSDIYNASLSLVIAKNSTLNAFAVPGGIIGIHTGLLYHAKTEQQLASVISHELAHLSQRHYARGVEKRKGQTATVMTGLLAGLILAATTEGDAGIAAISATQAYAAGQQLRFSRSFEREADRIGMTILARSGMSPHATAEMFEEMDKLTRFSSKPPEFLLTHPLTANRQVDAVNLARAYPQKIVPDNINYQLVRARAILETVESPQAAIQRFKDELSGFDTPVDGNRYGLALALLDNREPEKAGQAITVLLEKYPDNLILKITYNQILAGKKDFVTATNNLQQLIKQYPDYYPLPFYLSQLYRQQNDFLAAINVLELLSKARPKDPLIWYELAEISGLANNISLLNKARAEYFILHANFDNAEQQLKALAERESASAVLKRYAKERLQALETIRSRSKL
ncbi:MAG: putative Zn-dependent protease [Candidatus Endobugula sp.]|jgi:predicted Zn-dependent protease